MMVSSMFCASSFVSRPGFALDFHRRQTGTMSAFVAQEPVPITSCSAGQPPTHAGALQSPH